MSILKHPVNAIINGGWAVLETLDSFIDWSIKNES